MATVNSFDTRKDPASGRQVGRLLQPDRARGAGFPQIARLPYSLKILLENLLRCEDDRFVKAADIEALARWDVKGTGAEGDFRSRPPACCSRISPASRAWSISRRCATRAGSSAAIRTASTRCSRSSS